MVATQHRDQQGELPVQVAIVLVDSSSAWGITVDEDVVVKWEPTEMEVEKYQGGLETDRPPVIDLDEGRVIDRRVR